MLKNVKNDSFNFFLKNKEMLKQIHEKCYEQLLLSFQTLETYKLFQNNLSNLFD